MMLLRMQGGAPVKAGFHRRWPYDVAAAPPTPPVHAGRYASDLLEAAGIPVRTRQPVLHVAPDARAAAAELMREHGLEAGRFAVFMPGCAPEGYLKRWGTDRFAALVEATVPTLAHRVALVGGPDEAEVCAELAHRLPQQTVNLCGQTGLLDIVPLCESARFIVSNDTGTAHLASASGQPLCVICGPTDPRRVLPLGPSVVSAQADLACINCYRKHCDYHACMTLVTPQDVLRALASGGAR